MLVDAISKPLKNTKHRQLPNVFPRQRNVTRPILHESISLIIPDSSQKEDRLLRRLQQFTMDSLGALLYLQEQLAEWSMADPKKIRAAVKTSITLLGNVAVHFNLKCRRSAMKHLNKDLQPLAKGTFPNRSPSLFGEDFGTRSKSMSDSIKALKITLGKRNAPFSNGGNPMRKRKYSSQNPQGRRMYGVSPHQLSAELTAGSIFQRLGPQSCPKPTNPQASSSNSNK